MTGGRELTDCNNGSTPALTFIPVILSGGSGSRLWPLSREAYPKPFISLPGGGTLIGKTYARVARLPGVQRIISVTNREFLFLTADAYAEIDAPDTENIFLLEPCGRDTAAAVALAVLHAAETAGPDTVLLVLPADHLIQDELAFVAAVERAAILAAGGRIVTFGVIPERPETGFGYIEAEGENVLRFVEKPDAATAAQYIESGRFFWNSGMFAFTPGIMLETMEKLCPGVLAGAREAYRQARRNDSNRRTTFEIEKECFAATPAISFDYAVMEKTDKVACVPVSCGWSDIGSWAAMAELVDVGANGNRVSDEAVFEDAENCFVYGGERLIGLVGVSDLLVIDTPDALLVVSSERTQDVKVLYNRLKRQKHETAIFPRTVSRPWGTFTVLEEGPRFKIKRIVVKPGASLSLQMHHHRSEHWIVVSGMAKVINGSNEIFVNTNESTYIPAGHQHCLENPGILDLVMIEVQSGEYLGEDDIVRFQDRYGRIS